MTQYSQITEEERYHIYAHIKLGHSPEFIAVSLGRHRSSIYRELARNTGQRGYRPKQAHELSVTRRKQAKKPSKLTLELIEIIEEKLLEDWSPEQISGWLMTEHDAMLSHERIYQHIWTNKKLGGELYKHLRRQHKKYQKRSHGRTSRGQIKNRVSIEARPQVVDDKSRVGDWEIDTVIGKGHQGALVTLVERKTLFTLAAQVESKQAELVTNATISLLKPYMNRTFTITADNGKEFANHESISKALNTKFYFAHPYHSWERGLNENTNGLLRQYFPKDTNLKKIQQDQVDEAIEKLNNRPRKTLGYKTPAEMMMRSISRSAA